MGPNAKRALTEDEGFSRLGRVVEVASVSALTCTVLLNLHSASWSLALVGAVIAWVVTAALLGRLWRPRSQNAASLWWPSIAAALVPVTMGLWASTSPRPEPVVAIAAPAPVQPAAAPVPETLISVIAAIPDALTPIPVTAEMISTKELRTIAVSCWVDDLKAQVLLPGDPVWHDAGTATGNRLRVPKYFDRVEPGKKFFVQCPHSIVFSSSKGVLRYLPGASVGVELTYSEPGIVGRQSARKNFELTTDGPAYRWDLVY